MIIQAAKKPFLFLVILSSFFAPQLKASNINGRKVLEETSQAFIDIGKNAVPAAVFIKSQIKHHNTAHYGQDPFDLFNDEFFRRFFGNPSIRPKSEPQPELSSGSGFIVSPDGHILTNFHVVKDADEITVLLNDGREFEATVIGTDPKTDLAVLKIEAKDLPCLEFGNSDHLQIGEWVVAIGNPFALESTLTHGVVSAKGRQDLGITSLEDFIQTDAAINPGNSGGPLLNLNGEVIGINTAIVSRSGGYMGIGFAIPSNMAKHVLDQILDTGKVERAYLGIILQPLDKDLIDALSLEENSDGILISEVMKDTPAEKAGLKHGDIIIELNGKIVKNHNKFRNEIALMNPGTFVNLKILRNGKHQSLKVELGALSEQEVSSAEFFDKLGIDVDSLSNISTDMLSKLGLEPHESGVLITKVKPGSPAAQAGLRPYYLITALVINWKNQIKINNSDDLTRALREVTGNKYVVLIVRHQKYQKYYTLKMQ